MAAVIMTFGLADTAMHAQTPLPPEAGRPFGGVFVGKRTDQSTEALALTVSVSEAYDNDIVGTQSNLGGPAQGALFSRLSGQLNYSKRKERLRFMAGGGFGLDYYNNLDADIPQPVDTYQGAASLIFSTRRMLFQASQRVSYYPYFGFDLAGLGPSLDPSVSVGNVPSARPDAALLEEPVVTYGTSTSAGFPLGRRSTATFGYSYSGAQESDQWPTVNGQSASAMLSRSVSRSVSLSASYGYEFANYRSRDLPSTDFTSHTLMGGVSWNRRLSQTRALSVNATAGHSILGDSAATGIESRRNVLAGAGIGFQFARSWTVQSNYNRSLQYVQGLSAPYYGDSVSLALQGEPTRRLEFSASVGVVRSDSATVDGAGQGFDTRSGTLHARYALAPKLAVFAQYSRTQYEFGTGALLPSGVLPRFDRDVIQFGLTFGHVLFRRR